MLESQTQRRGSQFQLGLSREGKEIGAMRPDGRQEAVAQADWNRRGAALKKSPGAGRESRCVEAALTVTGGYVRRQLREHKRSEEREEDEQKSRANRDVRSCRRRRIPEPQTE